MDFARMDQLIKEIEPLLAELENVSLTKILYESLGDFDDYVSIERTKEILQDWKEMIPNLCYTDTYVVRYEIICEYPQSYVESGTDFFSYGYSYKSDMYADYNHYKAYLDEHYELLRTEAYDDGSSDYIYDVGNGEELELSTLVIDEWEIYCVWITPPYLAEYEQDW